MIPLKIERKSPNQLALTYANEPELRIATPFLRKNCPCAMCREERGDGASHSQPLTAPASAIKKPSSLKIIEHTANESNSLEQVFGVGNYAIGLRWADGHDDGIYSWPYLRSLALEFRES